MTKLFKLALGSALAAALLSQPGMAQTAKKPAAAAPASAAPRGTIAAGIGTVDVQAAVASTNAYKTAVTTRQNDPTYKKIYDAAQARLTQLQGQLKPMADQFNADRAANKSDAVLQAEYDGIQKAQAQGEAEIKQILAPANLSDEYVVEQITAKLPDALGTVMGRRGVTMLLNPDAILLSAQPYDLTGELVNELNRTVTSVQITPPPGWQPARVRQQQQQQQQAAGTAPKPTVPATKPAGPQPEGR
ncbi:MAG: OmpH family outer membrane protein [Novosphingobium sp.]